MRQNGATQFESLKTIHNNLKLSLKEADKIILESNTWADCKIKIIEFRNEFADFLEKFDHSEPNEVTYKFMNNKIVP